MKAFGQQLPGRRLVRRGAQYPHALVGNRHRDFEHLFFLGKQVRRVLGEPMLPTEATPPTLYQPQPVPAGPGVERNSFRSGAPEDAVLRERNEFRSTARNCR